MTTLTFDLSELDRELGDLLAYRWTMCLCHTPLRVPRKGGPSEPKVIAPPPTSAVLTWEFSVPCSVTSAVLMCDSEIVTAWPISLRFLAGDSLCVTLVLT